MISEGQQLPVDVAADLATFRRDATRFLDQHAEPRSDEMQWGHGDDRLAGYAPMSAGEEAERLVAAREWKAVEFDAGFGWITGNPELGGRGLPPEYERAYLELRSGYDTPSLDAFAISLGMVAPAFERFGSAEVRALVPRMRRGDLIGCQLFSEPTNGSDVAGLVTKAVRDGQQWVIDGQKVWTSGAHHSDWGLLIARSNPEAPKHAGITAFALDMSSPGVEVRPLVMMTGGTEFNEVFFDGVPVPDDRRLGEVDQGWGVAIATLMNERALGAGGDDLFGTFRALERLRLTIEHLEVGDDPIVRDEFARLHSAATTIRYQAQAADQRRRAGLPPGPAESVFKLANTEVLRGIVDLGTRLCGPAATADTGAWGMWAWADLALMVPGLRLAGGTDEIMRNILAERVLGLPKEPG
jgi:alkylation response protein AidB-like acyl-CoA dehydrogenase